MVVDGNAVGSVPGAAGWPNGQPAVRPAGRGADAASGGPPADTTPVAPRMDADFLAHLTDHGNDAGLRQTFARFVVDPKTHDVSVEIVDATKGEVIRQIPHGDLMQLARQYRAANGLVLDSHV